LKIKER